MRPEESIRCLFYSPRRSRGGTTTKTGYHIPAPFASAGAVLQKKGPARQPGLVLRKSRSYLIGETVKLKIEMSPITWKVPGSVNPVNQV